METALRMLRMFAVAALVTFAVILIAGAAAYAAGETAHRLGASDDIAVVCAAIAGFAAAGGCGAALAAYDG